MVGAPEMAVLMKSRRCACRLGAHLFFAPKPSLQNEKSLFPNTSKYHGLMDDEDDDDEDEDDGDHDDTDGDEDDEDDDRGEDEGRW